VLVFGCFNQAQAATSDLFDNGVWKPGASVAATEGRGEAIALKLSDGRVLVMGGEINGGAAPTDIFTDTLLYDPALDTFTLGPNMVGPRRDMSASQLTDGGIWIVAGRLETGAGDLYTTVMGTPAGWLAGPTLTLDRTAAVLFRQPDETLAVLVGGSVGPVELRDPSTGALSTSFTPATLAGSSVGVPTVDGRLVLTGGVEVGGAYTQHLQVVELRTLGVTPDAPIPGNRERHSATLLPDGRIFVAGGNGSPISLMLWDEDAGFLDAGQMTQPRSGHASALLPNGDVLLVGGFASPQTAERCRPGGTCRAIGPPLHPLYRNSSAVLHDGRVLLLGGSTDGVVEQAMIEVYDPDTDAFTDAGVMLLPRHQATSVTLPDGRVLTGAGYSALGDSAQAELYDPATGTVSSAGSTAVAHGDAPLVLLPDGRVAMVGGYGAAALPDSEVWLPDAGWQPLANLGTARALAVPIVMRDDRAYFVGGSDGTLSLTPIDRLELNADAFEGQTPLGTPRCYHSLTLLPSGEVLAIGGLNGNVTILNTVERLRLGPPVSPRLQPTLAQIPLQLITGAAYDFQGTLLTGVGDPSAGASRSSTPEVPTFRFERLDNQQVTHLGPTAWGPTSAHVVMPPDLASGWYALTVAVAGISSHAALVRVVLKAGSVCMTTSECADQCIQGVCSMGGPTDGGSTDGGSTDGGSTDGGPTDGGPTDGGPMDGGPMDGGPTDGGPTDAGPAADGGPLTARRLNVGCGCGQGAGGPGALLLGVLLSRRKKRRLHNRAGPCVVPGT
jgi:hypothetical protein